MSEWICVKGRLPYFSGDYLVWINECLEVAWFKRDGACWDGWYIDSLRNDEKPIKITHWMPLPTPPKEEV